MAANHSKMRLGKRSRRDDPRTLKLARYLLPGAYTAAVAPPSSCDYTRGAKDWGMMLNDRLGCCTISAVGHALQVWTANASKEITVPDSTILSYYQRWDGFNPRDASTDQGGVELDVLNDWRQQGFAGHTLDAYVSIGLGNREQGIEGKAQNPVPSPQPPDPSTQTPTACPDLALAIWLFGGAYIGVRLPITAQNQDVWDVPAHPGPNDEPGSWGGHAVQLVGYDCGLPIADGRLSIEEPSVNRQSSIDNHQSFLTCITWGRLKRMTWAWLEKYCDEAYALVSKDWIKANGIAPSGFDFATLEADLNLVTA